VLKKFSLCCFCLAAPLIGIAARASAQVLAPATQAESAEPATPSIPDDVRVTLMVRNAVVALSQANLTGNYSVLRDMGTPSFQITNSSARLAEAFTTLRARRIDLSPVMFFNLKLIAPPVYQEGQVLRVAGYFPTTPEQVHFDIAFQKFGEQWMIAGIAVNVAPPGEGPQASATPETQTASDTASTAKPGEAKPIRIDLSQPAAAGAKPASPKKPVAAKKPKPPTQQKTAAAQSGATPATPAEQPAQAPAQAQPAPEQPAPAQKNTEFGAGWNPFGR
jgi:hypothetical protein